MANRVHYIFNLTMHMASCVHSTVLMQMTLVKWLYSGNDH